MKNYIIILSAIFFGGPILFGHDHSKSPGPDFIENKGQWPEHVNKCKGNAINYFQFKTQGIRFILVC